MWEIIRSTTPEIVWAGIKYTIPIAVISFAIGLVIAAITALIRISKPRGNGLVKGVWYLVKVIFSF